MQYVDKKVLVIDDDVRIVDLLAQILTKSGFNVATAATADEARKILKDQHFFILLVDYMLPNENGSEFVKKLRETDTETYVIMLTAIDSIDNKVLNFGNGVDDYITKPFEPKELIARMNRIYEKKNKKLVNFRGYLFDITTNVLTRNGKNIPLSSTESMLLHELCLTPDKAVSRSKLAEKAGIIVCDRTVDVQIARLRKKIGENTIETARHIGYVLRT